MVASIAARAFSEQGTRSSPRRDPLISVKGSEPSRGKIKKSIPCGTVFVILPRAAPRRILVSDHVRPLSAPGTSVKQDWRAWLPEEKEKVFLKQVRELESNYTMWSVSLNEAIELLQGGRLAKSLEAVGVTSGLCRLLTEPLAGLFRALCEHARHYGTIPNVAPLDPANFQGHRSQRSARMSGLLNRVLLSHRLQFLYKVTTLGEMVEDLGRGFRRAAADLAEGTSADPLSRWEEVDADHYDLNTCLREGIVLLKSFLVALPEDQLGAFQKTVHELSGCREAEAPLRQSAVRHRRMSPIAGE